MPKRFTGQRTLKVSKGKDVQFSGKLINNVLAVFNCKTGIKSSFKEVEIARFSSKNSC